MIAANDNASSCGLIGPWPPTRSMARKFRSLRYFTGIACCNGHVAPRLRSSGTCFECQRAWRDDNAADIAAAYVEWARANRESINKNGQDWRERNPELARSRARDLSRKTRDANPQGHAEASRAYYREHMKDADFRAKQSLRSKNNRAKRLGADGHFSKKDIDEIHASQGHRCAICRCDTNLAPQIDHIVPLTRGGTNWPSNIQILCKRCNCSKGAKTMEEYWKMVARRVANDNLSIGKAA